MPTDSVHPEDDKILIHRLKLEAELRAIQAQTHEARKADIADLERQVDQLREQVDSLTQDRNRLMAEVQGKRVIEEDEYARLKSAEYHLRRLLHRVDRSPLGLVARRRPGFRDMMAQQSEAPS